MRLTRLTLSLLAAIGLHGALLGVVAAVVSHAPARGEAPPAIEVDVEVSAPKPDPIADSAPPAPPTSALPKPHVARHLREVAMVDNSTPKAVPGPSTAAEARAGSPIAASNSPSPGPATTTRASATAAQSGGAAVSATPRYQTNPKPDYPIPSFRRREEGIVLLNVLVQTDGTPATISLNRSCGHPLLDRAALAAVHHWTFEPGRIAGVPVSNLVVVPVRFSLAEQP